MSDSNQSPYTHRVYHNNPILFKSYINKYVTITTKTSNTYHGIVYTVDPVSESIILFEPYDDDNLFKAKIVMGHCVKHIEIASKPEFQLPDMFPPMKELTEAQLIEKREAVKNKLIENCLSVIEKNDGILEIEGILVIEPPYELENCICNNSTVLSRISSILYKNDER